jgi:hypothetical protein
MKVQKSVSAEFRVWCDACYIRIAPNEAKTVVHGKAYHPHCHVKIKTSAKK